MNAKERTEWLEALGACRTDADLRGMSKASAALDRASSGTWEMSVCGVGHHSLGLRFFGTGPYKPWLAAAVKAFGLGACATAAPPPDYPWLSAAWDLRTGAWTSARVYGGAFVWEFAAGGKLPARRRLSPAAFKPGVFKEPLLDRALEDFTRLCPVATLSIEEPGWSLRLGRPLSWPLFARCDVAAAFASRSSQLALLLRDLRVTELSFDGEALWAHCAR